MDAYPTRSEFAVIGGGPAASTAALCLAKKGKSVVQLTGVPERRGRPPEILSPSTRFLLRRLQLFDAAELGVPCSGVMRCWESPEPDTAHYGLFQVVEARSVDRRELQGELAAQARNAGVAQIEARASIDPGENRVTWRNSKTGSRALQTERIILATGRSSGSPNSAGFQRDRCDRLVGFAFPWKRRSNESELILEAVEDGWWYAPPAFSETGQLIFVTDSDLYAQDAEQRQMSLERAFDRSELVRSLGKPVCFRKPNGIDAHSGAVQDPVIGPNVAIGDAAISLDPLSGSGIQYALEGASVAADELAKPGSLGTAYREWFQSLVSDQYRISKQRYADVARRFPNSIFWRRRI